ncbi:MAG TPA: branched-chain amino acid ABC transporter permease [Acidimicrobiia bacterium]|nr:branched-chain amino acid ABC transporter permease [Acidimicrobiia bacterium]
MDWSSIFENGMRDAVGIVAAVYALTAVGINLQFGYTGLANYGQAGFLLVGAYGTAIAVDQWDLSLWVAFLVGLLAAVGLGLLLGIPTLRLRADYLAIVTISAAEALRIVVNSRAAQDLTGGPQGIHGFADAFFDVNPFDGRFKIIGAWAYSNRDLWVTVIAWGAVALASFALYLLTRSPWGRVLRAVREDEDAARSLGKNVYAFKMQSLLIGGAIGGVAGMLLAVDRQFVDAQQFVANVTFLAYAALILGGLGRILGPVVGSMVLWFFVSALNQFLREAVANDFLGITHVMDENDVGAVRFILVGVLIMVLVIFRPQGILGSRSEVMLGDG